MAKRTEAEWMDWESPPREVYAYAPLVLTVCQFQFNNIISIGDQREVGRFQQFLLEDYATAFPMKSVDFQIDVGSFGGSLNSTEKQEGWIFSDVD